MTDFNEVLNPESSEAVMEQRECKCGCGTQMPSSNNWEYYRGHKPTGKKESNTTRKPRPIQDEPAHAEIEEAPVAELIVNEEQLDRVWTMFSLKQKAYAVVCGITEDRD